MAESSNIVVRCRGVTKNYGAGDTRVTALRGIDLEVRRCELLMLVGPSGCGKTTLISILAAILDRDGGDCVVLGHDLQQMNKTERARFRGGTIGFVFQAFNLLPALTVVENVAIPLLIRGKPRAQAFARTHELLDALGLRARAGALPAELSGGQQQRVAIARALVHSPQLIVCDEPTSNLDRETGRLIMEVLRGVGRSSGRTLVVVTHDPRILEFADRIVRMDDGRIVEVIKESAAEHLQ